MFGFKNRRAETDMRLGQEIEDRYSKTLQQWGDEHDADRQDMTPAQRERFRLHTRCADLDIEPVRVAFARWLVAEERCSDG